MLTPAIMVLGAARVISDKTSGFHVGVSSTLLSVRGVECELMVLAGALSSNSRSEKRSVIGVRSQKWTSVLSEALSSKSEHLTSQTYP